MKRTLFLLIALLFFPATVVLGQTAITLQSLEVELWPDYDREAVLVLLTGTLSSSQSLPVTLTIPLPEGADFNVAARITPDNLMSDQGITPDVGADSVTFTIDTNRFRVEYYQPYTASNTQRSFNFDWQSDIAVEQLNVTLQQPFTATEVTTIPPAASVNEGQDGLTYHVLPSQAVAAGDSYSLQVNYTLSVATLTVDFLVEEDVPTQTDLPFLDAVPAQDEAAIDWPVILIGLGVIVLVGTAVWYFLSNRPTNKRPAKPKPQRAAKNIPQQSTTSAPPPASTGKANFCHQCGESLQPSDKFCRSCGTKTKG
ncbi:MAG: zinc ribbon domain-containing protein [Anaerolineales bacterium]|nr:zinc ribbon domain-containing protein [Anaerolineales bacterium]MCB8939889.1 zinc ribbon domain-containing protein [Ardenticatenaceae bacterium]